MRTRRLTKVENWHVIDELKEKAEREYPGLHGEEGYEEYLAAVIDVAAAEITKLRAQVEALREVAAAEITKLRAQVEALTEEERKLQEFETQKAALSPKDRKELREQAVAELMEEGYSPVLLAPHVLTKRPRATVPKAVYEAQTRECEIKTGVIKHLVRENETQRSIINGFQRLLNGFWRIESCSPKGKGK